MTLNTGVRDAAFRWIADDPDPATRTELQAVLAAAMAGDAAAAAELAERMAPPLRFGTAGLRGPVRAGSNGMNRAVVIRTTAGVVGWLDASGHTGGVVVVGRDARHGSARFARDAADVLSAAGFGVRQLSEPLPTPVLAFAVRQLNAVAGIQITASHNPAADNGFKLYDETGAQLIGPADTEVEAAIAAVPAAVSVPRLDAAVPVRDEVLRPYLDRVASLPRGDARDLRIAISALHGVGGPTVAEAFRRAGFTDVHLIQDTPDPDFAGMGFPNPEEPGVCDELLRLAAQVDADLAIALDPDADRCALGIPTANGFRMLSGDETGTLIADHILSTVDTPEPLVATTIVSSSLLRSIAAARGARYAETLTGFKWLARAGDGLVFAYEEAIGLCVDPDAVRDKDGISAAIVAADLAATRKARGSSLTEALDELAAEHGVHLTAQVSIRTAGPQTLMARLRDAPPVFLGGADVTAEDLMPRADVLRLTGDGVRAIVRPSGTEPKLKAYLEVVEPVGDASLAEARDGAQSRLDLLHTDVAELLD